MELNYYRDKKSSWMPNHKNIWWGVDYYDTIDSVQPMHVCIDCAGEFGYWKINGPGVDKAPINLMNSNTDWQYGNCDVCGKEANITRPKYYGYLHKGWQDKKK